MKKIIINVLGFLLASTSLCLSMNTDATELAQHEIQCAICFDTLETPAQLIPLECSHTFHRECIKKWVEQEHAQTTCPTCRRKISRRQVDLILQPSVELNRLQTIGSIALGCKVAWLAYTSLSSEACVLISCGLGVAKIASILKNQRLLHNRFNRLNRFNRQTYA